MANSKINDYSVGDASIDDVMLTLDSAYKGKINLTLTEMDSTTVPKIAAGSVVEVNGALFKFTADETIRGSPSDGTVYVKLVPAVGGGSVTPTFTNTAPEWDDEKQGDYESTTSNRYVAVMEKSGTSYTDKFLIGNKSGYKKVLTSSGTWTCPSTGSYQLEVVGKGGDGGGASTASGTAYGGGGGAGTYGRVNVFIYAGTTYTYTYTSTDFAENNFTDGTNQYRSRNGQSGSSQSGSGSANAGQGADMFLIRNYPEFDVYVGGQPGHGLSGGSTPVGAGNSQYRGTDSPGNVGLGYGSGASGAISTFATHGTTSGGTGAVIITKLS